MTFSNKQQYFLARIRSVMDTLHELSHENISHSRYLDCIFLIDTAHRDVIKALDQIIEDEPAMEDVYI